MQIQDWFLLEFNCQCPLLVRTSLTLFLELETSLAVPILAVPILGMKVCRFARLPVWVMGNLYSPYFPFGGLINSTISSFLSMKNLYTLPRTGIPALPTYPSVPRQRRERQTWLRLGQSNSSCQLDSATWPSSQLAHSTFPPPPLRVLIYMLGTLLRWFKILLHSAF